MEHATLVTATLVTSERLQLLRNFLGFKTHCKLLLMVLNKALDMIDNSGATQSRRRRSANSLTNFGSFNSGEQQSMLDTSYEEKIFKKK